MASGPDGFGMVRAAVWYRVSSGADEQAAAAEVGETGESGGWRLAWAVLDDSEQSLVVHSQGCDGQVGEAELVAGLHESSVTVLAKGGAGGHHASLPAPLCDGQVVCVALKSCCGPSNSTGTGVGVGAGAGAGAGSRSKTSLAGTEREEEEVAAATAAPGGGSSSKVLLGFCDFGAVARWVALLKRASFPPGALWGGAAQDMSAYAISRLACRKVGAVWRAEPARVSDLEDSLRLCQLGSLAHDRDSSSLLLLLLRLKAFGCTVSMDRVHAQARKADQQHKQQQRGNQEQAKAAEKEEETSESSEAVPEQRAAAGSVDAGAKVEEMEALKQATLSELLVFVEDVGAGAVDLGGCCGADGKLDGTAVGDLVAMIALNVVRPLHCFEAGQEVVPAEVLSAARATKRAEECADWPALSLCYEMLLKLVSGGACDLETKKRCLSDRFCGDFLQLFRSRDPREREYVKTITHCMYSRLVVHRGAMRLGMANAFLEFAFVSKQHAGIAEMLEVFGSVAMGFAVPIKHEHRVMLQKCLLPLHGPKGSELYQEQLSFVLLQYVTKEPDLVVPVVLALLRFWPKRNAAKQILFLSELGEVVGFMEPRHFAAVRARVVRRLSECISGPHFQVTEYAMGLLNNNYLYAMIFENSADREAVLPPLLLALRKAARSWNASVKQIGADIIEFIENLDADFFKRCNAQCQVIEQQAAAAAAAADAETTAHATLPASAEADTAAAAAAAAAGGTDDEQRPEVAEQHEVQEQEHDEQKDPAAVDGEERGEDEVGSSSTRGATSNNAKARVGAVVPGSPAARSPSRGLGAVQAQLEINTALLPTDGDDSERDNNLVDDLDDVTSPAKMPRSPSLLARSPTKMPHTEMLLSPRPVRHHVAATPEVDESKQGQGPEQPLQQQQQQQHGSDKDSGAAPPAATRSRNNNNNNHDDDDDGDNPVAGSDETDTGIIMNATAPELAAAE